MLSLLSDHSDETWWYYPHKIIAPWPFALLVRQIETADYDREWAHQVGKYNITISAASPEAAGPAGRDNARSFYGASQADWDTMSYLEKCHCLVLCGCCARLWDGYGNNKAKLITDTKRRLRVIEKEFDKSMQSRQNLYGMSGYDFIVGRGRRHNQEHENAEQQT